jgi:hypothetical protein
LGGHASGTGQDGMLVINFFMIYETSFPEQTKELSSNKRKQHFREQFVRSLSEPAAMLAEAKTIRVVLQSLLNI